jgi:HSP20 family protein
MAESTQELQQSPDRGMEPRPKQTLEREATRPGWMFRPDVDIVERPEEFVVTADLPGAGEDDVRIELENGVLSIDAQPSVRPDDAWQPAHAEYRLGGFHREFTMGEGIDPNGIAARMRDGVLEIHLPKAARHQPRRIEITRA